MRGAGAFPHGDTPEGARDMSGNVWEWTSSDFCAYDGGPCTAGAKVARGGGWFGSDAKLLRVTVRQAFPAVASSANVGMRCAKGL